MKKTIVSLFLAAIIASPLAAFGNVATVRAASINTAIRGTTNSTVYWYANDGKRYVFPNTATYYTWFTSFSNVQTISDSELFSIQLGGNVTYRPGAKLVKVTTDPKVYAVARGGILRHVTSESLAIQLYGYDWASKVQDLPDEFFINYTVGSPIYSTTDYNVSNEYNGVFSPSDSLRGMGQNNGNNQNGSLTLTADRTSITSGQAVYLTGNFYGTLPSGGYLEIKDVRNSNTIKTCYNTSTCTVTVYPTVDSSQNTVQYYIVAKNSNGTHIGTQYGPVIYTNGSSQNRTLTLKTDRTNITSGQSVFLDAVIGNGRPSNLNSGERIEIREVRTNNLVKTCYASTCYVTVYPYQNQTGYSSTQYVANLINAMGLTIATRYSSTIYIDGSSDNNGTFTLTVDDATITRGQAVNLHAYFNGTTYSGDRIDIQEVRTGSTIKTCNSTNSCWFTVYPSQANGANNVQYKAFRYNRFGSLVQEANVFVYFDGTSNGTSNDGVNYINGLTLQADRTSINNGDMVKLTANAYNTGNWSYIGNRIEIRDVRTGAIVKTCYDQSWCVADVSVTGNNGTAQYEARIYDRHGNFLMSQFSPVIYVNGSSNNGSTGYNQIPNTDIYIAPSNNVRPGNTVYLTASFTNLPYASTESIIRIYTEQSSTPVGTCSGSVSCSVPYTISNSGVNTRVYGVASNSSLSNTRETARIPLITF